MARVIDDLDVERVVLAQQLAGVIAGFLQSIEGVPASGQGLDRVSCAHATLFSLNGRGAGGAVLDDDPDHAAEHEDQNAYADQDAACETALS